MCHKSKCKVTQNYLPTQIFLKYFASYLDSLTVFGYQKYFTHTGRDAIHRVSVDNGDENTILYAIPCGEITILFDPV